jgi:hypothetical protein
MEIISALPWAFWTLFVLFHLFMLGFVAREQVIGPIVVTVVGAVCLAIGGYFPQIYNYVLQNRQEAIVGFFLYFVIGTIYAVCKWIWFNWRGHQRYLAFRKSFLLRKGLSTDIVPDELKKEFFDAFVSEYGRDYDNAPSDQIKIRPQIRDYKEEMAVWITYWPWSAFATILRACLKDLAEMIIEAIKGALQWFSNKIWAGVEKDLPIK